VNRSIPKIVLEVLAMSILGSSFVLNVAVVYGKALWWQWAFGLFLSIAGGLLVAIAISSLLRRPAATDKDDTQGNDATLRATSADPKAGPDRPRSRGGTGAVQPIHLQDEFVSLPGIGREKASVARTFGVSTLQDFVRLDGDSKQALRKALGPSLFDRVSSIAAQVSVTAGK
jgi:hypothetical protein